MATKYALVTGASSGIGLGIAIDLLKEGYFVFANGRSAERLEKAFAELKQDQDVLNRLVFEVGDATEEADIVRILADIAASTGGTLDVLVNNAGAASVGVVPGTSGFTAAAMRKTLETFIGGPTLVLHHAVPLLEKAVAVRGGTASVVNITSNASQRHGAAVPVYSAAKAAMDSITKSSAANLGPKSIRVNAVAPGPVFTNVLISAGLTQEQSDAFFGDYGAKTPLGRAGKPQEIANMVSFLANHEKSAWITGAVYVVDGGMLASPA